MAFITLPDSLIQVGKTITRTLFKTYIKDNLDDLDTRQIDPTDLRQAIGTVPQEPFLFMGSIKDNLTIGEQFVSDEELLRVSKVAGLDEFLGKHEAGYDLLVGERGEEKIFAGVGQNRSGRGRERIERNRESGKES